MHQVRTLKILIGSLCKLIALSFATFALFVGVLSSGAGEVFAAELNLHVELNPVGSFIGKSSKVKGSVKKKDGAYSAKNIELELDSLKSGISLRDKHMKEKYFETKKYPEAKLQKATGKGGKFSGILMIRKIKKKISGKYEVDGSTLKFEFKTKLSDFKIKEAAYMGVGVVDEVKVTGELPIE